jgi:RNA polymerase sigma-70 factor (ECF subfamily)
MQAATRVANETLAQHRRYLFGYALARLREADAAEELVQDTLLAALESASSFNGKSSLRTWLTAILKHKIIDWKRRAARNPVIELRTFSDDDGDHEESIDALCDSHESWMGGAQAALNPEQSLENRRFWDIFERGLNRLPKAIARAFYLREIQGMDTEEICRELGVSTANCWVMLHRARASLKRDLAERRFAAGGSMQSA